MEEVTSNKPKKGLKKWIFVLIATFLALVIFAGGFAVGYCSDSSEVKRAREVIRYIEGLAIYAETDVDKDEIARAVVATYLAEDKYAKYYSKEEFERSEREGKGNFSGFGFNFYVRQATGYPIPEEGLFDVYKNSSAYKAGLKKGDVLTYGKFKGDEEFIPLAENKETAEFFAKCVEGTEITVKVTREGEFTDKEFTLTKGKFTVSYVAYKDSGVQYDFIDDGGELKGVATEKSFPFSSDTAYIEFTLFEGNADKEMEQALNFMQERGRSKLILDLRNNGGGYMTTLIEIASQFINNGGQSRNVIAVTVDKKGRKDEYVAKNNFRSFITDLAVIANGDTASASECLLGALLFYKDMNFSMDNLVLTYNGKRNDYSTYGKGIMQNTFHLSFGGAIKFTTGKVCQPDGVTCIQDVGIKQENPLNCVENGNAVNRAIEILGG